MTAIIKKTWNSYRRNDGYIMGWERAENIGDGHRVTMMNDNGKPVTFRWRSAAEPVSNQKVSVVMVEDGVSARRQNPILLLNHDTGEVLREQNAPNPVGTRPIMIALGLWVLIAMTISTLLIAHTEGVTFMAITLTAVAFVIWRLAIATAELRADERAQKRIRDEEGVCLDLMTSQWRLASEQVFMMRGRKQTDDVAP